MNETELLAMHHTMAKFEEP